MTNRPIFDLGLIFWWKLLLLKRFLVVNLQLDFQFGMYDC